MAYTTINKSTDYFDTVLWSSQDTSIDTLNFAPDWAWIKSRTNADTHVLFDKVRGANKRLISSGDLAESTTSDELTAFNSDGYTLGTGDNVNRSGHNYVSWNWRAGGTGSANSDGSIASTVSANTTAGFSIVSYTGNNTNGATVGHGLGVAPAMVIFKNRGSTNSWHVYHKDLPTPQTSLLLLDTTGSRYTSNNYMYGTVPSSSLLYLGNSGATNENGVNHIAYCFAEKPGYSKFGSYTGNGSTDGTFVYTGFKPSFLMIKNYTTGAYSWTINDSVRTPHNVMDKWLYPNIDNAEATGSSYNMDLLSNGFKSRNTGSNTNDNNNGYIYMAFGQSLVGSNNVPATAR